MGGSCPALQLTVAGQSVSTAASTEFKHFLCSEVSQGMMVRIRGNLQSGGSILAERVINRSREDDDDDEDDDVEVRDGKVEGIVSAVAGACPALTITVGTSSPAAITTTTATEFDGIQCSAIATGVDIEAEGTTQADGSLLATKVEPHGVVAPMRRR